MKKLLMVAFTVLVAASLAFAQGGATDGKAGGGKAAPTSEHKGEKKGQKGGKKGQNGGKRSKAPAPGCARPGLSGRCGQGSATAGSQ
jgi:hypothetical protein